MALSQLDFLIERVNGKMAPSFIVVVVALMLFYGTQNYVSCHPE
jgi:hypothetical protein